MAEPLLTPLPVSASHQALMFPTLTPAQIERIAAHGVLRPIAPGEVLVEAGDPIVPFFVVKTGEIEIIRPSKPGRHAGRRPRPRQVHRRSGPDLSQGDLSAARWPLARSPHLLETSLPGVFAVGDVRGGNIKRVASAVGEGSIAVAFVHRALAE